MKTTDELMNLFADLFCDELEGFDLTLEDGTTYEIEETQSQRMKKKRKNLDEAIKNLGGKKKWF